MSDHTELTNVPLHHRHQELGGTMVSFAGHSMPVKYTNIKQEHRAVRSGCGLFDVSHMGRFSVRGERAVEMTDRLVTNDVEGLSDGQALYTVMCNEEGGIIDDLVVYRLHEQHLLLCANAANRGRDLEHIRQLFGGAAELEDRSEATVQLAVQGPDAQSLLDEISDGDLDSVGFFRCRYMEVAGVRTLVARTGYTGEDGFELYYPSDEAETVFDALMEFQTAGLTPCGLGARDTLRLEAGLLLHGQDIDETTNPLEANLGWLVKFDAKDQFVGRAALEEIRSRGVERRLRGFVLEGRGVLRAGYPVQLDDRTVGQLTSGGYAPTLEESIGLGYIDTDCEDAERVDVTIRSRRVEARVVDPPFYDRSD